MCSQRAIFPSTESNRRHSQRKDLRIRHNPGNTVDDSPNLLFMITRFCLRQHHTQTAPTTSPRARTRTKTAPTLVEENSDIGAKLAADIPYMNPMAAAHATTLINHWRRMPREEFFASCARL
jgi:hypothetical protein